MLCLTIADAFSQQAKTSAFAKFPEVIQCNVAQFENAFQVSEGNPITISFESGLTLNGTVLSNEQKYHNLRSMTIIIPGYANAVFHLSKQLNTDRSNSFVGRILSRESKDGYEIKKDEAGNYRLMKIDEEKLRELCSH